MVKPILFNTEMVRAILDGRKTVTRRVAKPHPNGTKEPYLPGDVLWVRETWAPLYADDNSTETVGYLYKADPDCQTMEDYDRKYPDWKDWTWEGRWRPSIHMPKEAARIFLRVTDVRVERLQEIDVDGIRAEGLTSACVHAGDMEIAAQEFALLWNSTINPADRDRYGWEANPFCWVIEFERCEKPEEV